MHHLWKFLLLVTLLAGVLLVPAPMPATAAPLFGPPSGWVKADVVGGGCDNAGHCNSNVRPGNPTLYEYRPDRQPVGEDARVTSDLAQHGGYPTFEQRDLCHVNGIAYYWSAGIWHHGGYWTLTYDAQGREHWSGPSRQHWAFEHNDICRPLPTPIPTDRPTDVPPLPLGVPTYTPVILPPTTMPTDVPASPCTSSVGRFDERANMQITVPNVSAKEYAWDAPMDTSNTPIGQAYPLSLTRIPPYPLPEAHVQPEVPLTFAYDFLSVERGPVDKNTYQSGHSGQARIAFGLRDLTTDETLIAADTQDMKDLKNSRGAIVRNGRTLQLRSVTIDPRVSFRAGAMVFAHFDVLHSGAWNPRSATPQTTYYVAPNLGTAYVQFTPQSGHTYTVWTWNGHGSCRIEAPRWTVAQFTATNNPPVTFTPIPLIGTPTASPTPSPSPTPLPPRPPVPNARFTISIHSTLDPNSTDLDPRNGVYRSTGNRIAWPAGEVLDFTPRVAMMLSPATPAYAGYRFQAHVEGWNCVSSLGQNAAITRDGMGIVGCRGDGRLTSGSTGGLVCS